MFSMVISILTVLLCIAVPVLGVVLLYFIIKWAVKNGIKEAFRDMKGITSEEEYIENLQKRFNENKNEFGLKVDLAASEKNHKLEKFY